MQDISIVILNYNGKSLLEKFMPSVIQFSNSAEIIVVDNCSTDDSVPFLKQNFPNVRLILNKENHGFSGGYNEGLKHVDSEYYVLLNSDVEVTEGWLDAPLALLKSNTNIAACQPKIKAYRDKKSFEYAGAAGGYLDYFGFPFCKGRIFDELEEDLSQYEEQEAIFWATGAAMFVRSKVFHYLGGFEDSFFAHMEEVDLCWRMHRAGYEVFYSPKSTVYHLGGATLDKENPHKTFLNFRNSLACLFYNTRWKDLIWVFPVRILLDFVAGFKFFLDGKSKDGKAVLKALKEFFFNYRFHNSIKIKRARFLAYPSIQTLYSKSIVFDFFIKGKKWFKDLDFMKN